jgi:hypothetical protein
VAHELKALVTNQMLDVAAPPGEEIVGDNNLIAARQQAIA